MNRIHQHGMQATANAELTGWAVESTKDGLQTVAGGFIDPATREVLFAGGRRAIEIWLRAKLHEAEVAAACCVS